MLILSPEEAKVGMKLAAPVPHPEHPEQELLRAGYALEADVIQRLCAMGVQYLFVDFPGFEDLDRQLAAFLSPQRQAVYQTMKQTVEASQRRTRPAVSYGEYYKATRELITTLLDQGQHPLFLDLMARCGADHVGHATAVAHLSLLLGIKLDSYLVEERPRLNARLAKDPVNLGVAGMLHDVGKFHLPENLWNHSIANTPKSQALVDQWRAHPRIGYELIREGVEPTAATAVLQHHQHYDGSGFPSIATSSEQRPLAGKRIHVFARIVQVADLYDRLATDRVDDGPRRSNLEVLFLLRTRFGAWSDPIVLRALEEVAPPFPPGSKLQLSDGTSAIVLRADAGNPYRPVVRRTVGEEWKFEGAPIDLRDDSTPAIVSVGRTRTAGLVPA